jgi:hypothetical protein
VEIECKRRVHMGRFVVGILNVLAILATMGIGVSAAPEVDTAGALGPYEGSFRGVAYGDGGTSALLTLDLTHRGNLVKGDVFLSEGLYVNGGFCGTVFVPATAQLIEGQTVVGNPGRLVANPTFDVGGFDLAVDFESNVSASGNVITAEAAVDLPWFCGRDPVFTATLYRD